MKQKQHFKKFIFLSVCLLLGQFVLAQDSTLVDMDSAYYAQKNAGGGFAGLQGRRSVYNSNAVRATSGAISPGKNENNVTNRTPAESCIIPTDPLWSFLPGNDDGSTAVINLGFTFDFYGTPYTQVYINNNGNLTFGAPFGGFTPSGFPSGQQMIAGFWDDVDTRTCGRVRYKLFGTRLVVSYEGVGKFFQNCTGLNTFQIIIGTTNDPLIGLGQNVKFYYGDMQWTNGASTVGINKGDNVNYIQVGRFGILNSTVYDGGGGNTDGLDYLDYQCFAFNVSNAGNIPPSFSGFPANNTININCGQTVNLVIQALPPEVNQTVSTTVNTGGLCNTISTTTNGTVSTTNFSITGNACNEGPNIITFTATDNGSPAASTTVSLTVNVINCCVAPTITCPANISVNAGAGSCGATVSFSATATGTSPAITYSHASGSFFPVGTTTVTATATNGCGTASCNFTVTVTDTQNPVITCPANITVNNTPGSCAAVVYYGSNDFYTTNNSGTELAKIDVNTGAVTTIGSFGYSATWALAFKPDGTAWTTVEWGQLASVNLTTGEATPVGTPFGFISICLDANSSGVLYTLGWNANLYTVNTTTGALTFIANTGLGNVMDIAFDASDKLWAINSSGNLYSINTTTGAATLESTLSGGISAGSEMGLAISPGGTFYLTEHLNSPRLFSVDPATGVTTLINSMAASYPHGGDFSPLDGVATAIDNCGIPTITYSHPSGSIFPTGTTTVTATATDASGNTASCTFTVTVNDNEAPVITVQNIARCFADDNFGCSISLGATATDNCTLESLTSNAPTCFPLGTTTVTWTATDLDGNVSTATQLVTRNPEININICAGPTRTIYTGTTSGVGPFGPQSVNLSSVVTGGTPGYSYKWTPSTGLNNVLIANPVASPGVTTTYTLTVTDSKGCKRSLSITINVLPLSAAVCSGSGNNVKFSVCHIPPGNPSNPQNICISVNALNAHLTNGSNGHSNCYLGTCQQNCFSTIPGAASLITRTQTVEEVMVSEAPIVEVQQPDFRVNVYPNPSAYDFSIQVSSKSNEPVTVRILDLNGKVLSVYARQTKANNIKVGDKLLGGTYIAEVIQGANRKTLKLVKLN